MATTNYGLEEINKNTDVLSPDPINRNMVKIDTQMKANERAVQTVAEQVANINVTTDVEEVVNRRLNTDRTKSLNTIIGEWKDAIITAINTAKDNIKAHVTSEHTSSKSTLNTAIVSARDSVNSNVDAEHISTRKAVTDARDNIKSHVTSAVNNKTFGVVKSVQRGTVDYSKPTIATSNKTHTRDIGINWVDMNKSILIIDYHISDFPISSSADGSVRNSRVVLSANNKITQTSTLWGGTDTSKIFTFYGFSWQVVEYY